MQEVQMRKKLRKDAKNRAASCDERSQKTPVIGFCATTTAITQSKSEVHK
jgi:hypothetical protein